MRGPVTPVALTLYFALLSSISIGGIPSVLPDIRDYVVAANGGLSDAEFANFFAIAQMLPGPNLILMMILIGWRIGGRSTAIAIALATLGPPCAMYYLAFRLWNRFRVAPWQRAARRGLIPVTIGLIIGGGTVIAHVADTNWQRAIVSVVAAALLLGVRINPLWILIASGTAGAVGFL
jgi:chromate transporter